ncbi:MAG: GspH/FimT family pseudopilin [Armatimonadota bacterium]|nr:MAG: GspH/FimT family pseudopilin [Armatimonadota bacterium]
MRTQPRSRAHRQGFTLIELLVVMIIVAIGFLALRPGIAGVRRGVENRRALRQLVGLFTFARTEAIGGGKLVRVMCDPDAGTFWAEAQVDPAVDRSEFGVLRVLGRERIQLPADLQLTDMALAGQIVEDPAQSPIYFYPDGRVDGAVLLLVDAAGRELTLKLAPATGRVRLSA